MITEKIKSLSSNEHIQHSIDTGKNGELNFIKACKLNGIEVIKSSDNQDIYNHIDFFIYGKGIDIKGYKKSHTQGFIIVEFKNVNGYSGSCSKESKCEWIAFQFQSCFWIVRKNELLNYCRQEVKNEYVESFNDCYKKLYTRKNRKDLMTKLSLSDLKTFNFIWKLNF
tara:strand:- start:84 stop:587 length:504 start_codon:yes stop_codon:yes gene_type:complete